MTRPVGHFNGSFSQFIIRIFQENFIDSLFKIANKCMMLNIISYLIFCLCHQLVF